KIFQPFETKATLSWGIHPIALPNLFAVITATGISKKQAALEIASNYNVKAEELLGIGDSTSDWQFIESCKYAGTVSNASEELKKLVKTKNKNDYFIGKSVDENGILDILDFYSL
ncbi:MAG: HAD hydrolase family protein, partial [Oligoflexia bacterium]|nr:HAD hydrolase family protein [Oligoflexia bacterium]